MKYIQVYVNKSSPMSSNTFTYISLLSAEKNIILHETTIIRQVFFISNKFKVKWKLLIHYKRINIVFFIFK